jgi:GT2 family glycosyltransferase
MTASFIVHLRELLGKSMGMQVVIFDDGSTDETIINATKAMPSLTLINLGGKAYWGGAINAVSHYIQTRVQDATEDVVYLLANDDIRFPSKDALFAGINAVSTDSLICARSVLTPSIDAKSIAIKSDKVTPEPPIYYDHNKGIFLKATQDSPANVSSTWAMLSTREAWCSNITIPQSIPHYLSDYWFTYNLVKLGFNLRQPKQFICYVSTASTRNKPSAAKPNDIFSKLRDRVKSNLQVTSTSYAPAWIEFLSQEPISTAVKRKLLKLKLKVAIYRLLSCFSIRNKRHAQSE